MLVNEPRGMRGVVPLSTMSGIVVLVAIGQARGLWLSNVHNALLALAFGIVGAHVSLERPGHRLGRLFLVTGAAEAVMFFGRQVGHTSTTSAGRWLGWLGVWPVVITLALTTASVLYFPDGRLPTPRWRGVVLVVTVVAAACAATSALWPVEYDSTAITTRHPVNATAPHLVTSLWSAIAHPAYAAMQILWVGAVIARWRRSTGVVRAQLAVLALAAVASLIALTVGLAIWRTPRAGVLAVTLLPLAAGWAVVHGQHLAEYVALSWLSRAGAGPDDLAAHLAKAVAEALGAPAAALWVGDEVLHAVGVWPDTDSVVTPSSLAQLLASTTHHVLGVVKDGTHIGALTVERCRSDRLSSREQRLFADLASQARLVIENIGLAALINDVRSPTSIGALSPREHDVLALIALGRSNAAICAELHLSIKTVEPIVSTIFAKLGLPADGASNRRVLAAALYLRATADPIG